MIVIREFIFQHWRVLLIYFASISLLSFALFGIDKRRARRGMWRIPESTLLLTALLGGSIGAFIGMRVFHHKTHHRKFTIGVPLIFLLETGIIIYFCFFS